MAVAVGGGVPVGPPEVWLGLAGGLALVALLVPALSAWRGATGPLGASLPLFFLVPVLLTSAIGGWRAGAVVSIVAVFVWDLYFISPLYSIDANDLGDVVPLAVFLAVALLAGQLTRAAREREEALRESEARQARILQAIPDLLFRISRTGEYLDVRANDEHLLYVPREAIVGRTVGELLPLPEGARHFEARLVVSGPDEVLGVVRDISAHQRAELGRAAAAAALLRNAEALRQSEQRWRTLIEAAPVAITLIDRQGRRVLVNEAFCALSGYAREELVGAQADRIYAEEQREAIMTSLRTRSLEGVVDQGEYTLLTKGGDRRAVLGHRTTVAGADGQPLRLSFLIDITARRQMEEALRAGSWARWSACSRPRRGPKGWA